MNSENREYREMVKENFDFPSWAEKRTKPEDELCVNFSIPYQELHGLTLEEKKDLPSIYRERHAVRYIYSSKETPVEERIVITVFECNSVPEAHETLIDELMTYMAPTLPTCESLGMNIGDVCFGSYGDRQTSLVFTRSNIVVTIASVGIHRLSVNEFAESIDSSIDRESSQ